MNILPYLRSQYDILTGIKQRMRDPDSARWTAVEMYNAINDSVARWGERVLVPFLYTLTGGYTAGVYSYSLPSYIRPPLDVQIQEINYYFPGQPILLLDPTATTWVDVPAWTLEPDGSGGQTLRLGVSPLSLAGRVIWWAQNGRLPTTIPTLNATITDTATSLVLASVVDIAPTGYVKIDNEWIAYVGVDVGASTTTLTNLTRALNETTAASHTSGTSVYFGVMAHRQDLFDQLQDQACAKLHGLFLTNASPQETEHHVFQTRYYQQLADEFWRRYVSPRPPKLILSRHGLGPLR